MKTISVFIVGTLFTMSGLMAQSLIEIRNGYGKKS